MRRTAGRVVLVAEPIQRPVYACSFETGSGLSDLSLMTVERTKDWNLVADPITVGMSALNLSWDTPYRLLASLTSLGCVCVVMGWFEASSPFNALGQIAASLGIAAGPDIAGSITQWLAARATAVVPVASVFLLTGVAFNLGDSRNRFTMPVPWRGAPSALLALAVIWEITPKAVPGLCMWAVVVTGLLGVVAFFSKGEKLKEWLTLTFLNLLFSAIFILFWALWPLARTAVKATAPR
jgi:hypothetical protein